MSIMDVDNVDDVDVIDVVDDVDEVDNVDNIVNIIEVKVIDETDVLIFGEKRLFIPEKQMQTNIVRWYHHYLQHPGETYWPGTVCCTIVDHEVFQYSISGAQSCHNHFLR